MYGILPQLNAAGLYSTKLTGAGAQHALLTVGRSYMIQSQGGDALIGFGVDSSTADTNAASGKGEKLTDGAPAILRAIGNSTVQYIAKTVDAADVLIWQCAAS